MAVAMFNCYKIATGKHSLCLSGKNSCSFYNQSRFIGRRKIIWKGWGFMAKKAVSIPSAFSGKKILLHFGAVEQLMAKCS